MFKNSKCKVYKTVADNHHLIAKITNYYLFFIKHNYHNFTMQFINILKITSETTPIALQTYEGRPTWLVAHRAHNYMTPLKTHIDINTHN